VISTKSTSLSNSLPVSSHLRVPRPFIWTQRTFDLVGRAIRRASTSGSSIQVSNIPTHPSTIGRGAYWRLYGPGSLPFPGPDGAARLQGSFHIYLGSLMFLGLVGIFITRVLSTVVLMTLFSGWLSLFRLLRGAAIKTDWRVSNASGIPSFLPSLMF